MFYLKYMLKKVAGFTLIELLVAITILAVVSGVGYTTYSKAQIASRDAKRKQDLRSIAAALDLYRQQNKRYPCTTITTDYTAPANWRDSSSGGFWLTDTGCGGTTVNFDANYINQMPVDPLKNTGNPALNPSLFGYAYWSGITSAAPCPVGTAVYYILATRLENDRDKDRNGSVSYRFCDGSTLLFSSNPDLYIVTSQ